jgi:hypothetical protein
MDEKGAKKELGEGKMYGALVVPADFTSSATALTGTLECELGDRRADDALASLLRTDSGHAVILADACRPGGGRTSTL